MLVGIPKNGTVYRNTGKNKGLRSGFEVSDYRYSLCEMAAQKNHN